MRAFIVFATTLLISQYGTAQQAGRGGGGGRGRGAEAVAPAYPGFECFENVATPEFPQSALQGGISGTVYINLQVTPQGADKIESKVVSAWDSASKILTPAVEKVIRASKFKPECAGKTVAVVYRYEIYGDPEASPKATERREGNAIYIASAPELATAAKRGATK